MSLPEACELLPAFEIIAMLFSVRKNGVSLSIEKIAESRAAKCSTLTGWTGFPGCLKSEPTSSYPFQR
jgi:hypothetical protein